MPQNFTVRPATAEDKSELLRLWQERLDTHSKVDKRLASSDDAAAQWWGAASVWLQNPQMRLLVAERPAPSGQGMQLIGYMVGGVQANLPMMSPSHYGLVSELVVDSHCKQGGVGKALLEALEKWLKGQGITYLEARVSHRNPIEQAFWRASGAQDYFDHLWYKLD